MSARIFVCTVEGPGPHEITHNLNTKDIFVEVFSRIPGRIPYPVPAMKEITNKDIMKIHIGQFELNLEDPEKSCWENGVDQTYQIRIVY